MSTRIRPTPAALAGAAVMIIGGASALPAQDSIRDTIPIELKTIEVTAERTRAAPPPELVVDVPAAAVQRQQSANAYDLVRRAAGLEVHEQGQGPGWASDVVIRGFTSDHSSDVLLVIDGVPINLPVHGHVEGYADWTLLSPAAVSSLRVIHGSASPLYGNFAFAGVVEVTTASDADGTTASFGGSSHGDAGGWIRTGRRTDHGGSAVAFEGRRDQGWRDNSESWLGNVLLRGWKRVGSRTRLEGGLAAYLAGWNSPGFVSVADYNAGRLTQAENTTDGGSGGRVVAQSAIVHPFANGSQLDVLGWAQLARSNVFLSLVDDDVLGQQEERDWRYATGITTSWRRPVGLGDLAVGIDGRADWDQYQLYSTVDRAPDSTRQRNDARFQQGGAYARWRGFLFGRVQYDLGLRGDVLRMTARDRAIPGEVFRTETHGVVSPKMGVRVLLGGPWSAVGNVSRGFRSAIGTIRDPNQPLVTAWSGELGLQVVGDRIRSQVSLFQTNTRNERILDPVSLQVSDAGTSRRRGISGSFAAVISSRIKITAEATYNDAKITGEQGPTVVPVRAAVIEGPRFDSVPFPHHDEPLTPGDVVPGVAQHLGRVELDVRATDRLDARALVRWSGAFTPIGEPGLETRPYAVTDIGASIRFGWGTLDVDLQNVLDKRFPEIRASGYINPGAPRTLRAALRLPSLAS